MSSGEEPENGTPPQAPVSLARRLNLPLLILYGLGVTIGAGIYVLVGATSAVAGVYAPISFLVAAVVVAVTAFSYAEMSTRHPVSAGEAAYMRAAFNARGLTLAVGLMVAASGIVSSAAISIGAAGYIGEVIPLPTTVLAVAVILIIGAIAAWGILESVTIAAIITLVEIGGLALVVCYGIASDPDLFARAGALVPPFELTAWTGILSASLLAFFAFVGFEDIPNVADEVIEPHKTLPRGIILTLLITTLIYFTVVSVIVLVVPMSDLAGSAVPLVFVFADAGPTITGIFNVASILATTNGVLIQIIMASRVLYGLARQGDLPEWLARVHPVTMTPLVSTGLVIALILIFVTLLPIAELAAMTSTIVLIVFSLVNLALLRVKRTDPNPPANVFVVPVWVPVLGFFLCIGLLMAGFLPN